MSQTDKALHARMHMQEQAKNAIRFADYMASIIVTVGGGKGKVMLDIARELVDAGKVKSILYVCDSTRLRDSDTEGFPAEIEKWGDDKLKKMITLECYQTTRKWEGRKFDLILGDEVDFAITKEYIKVFLNNEFKYKLLVSGTLSDAKWQILQKIAPIVYTFKTEAAEEAGVINKSEYFIYNYKMTDGECVEYNKLSRKIKILYAAGATFEDSDYMFWIRKRKFFLNSLDSSFVHCRKIMGWVYNQNKDNRLVIFCELTPQADRVCKYSYHGKNEKEDNLSKFQKGIINAIAVVAKIKRGINLIRANWAIFEGFSGSSTEWEQRNGRMKRLALTEVAGIIFMVPWFKVVDEEGNETWKPTIVREWINRATQNLTNIQFKNLKL